MTPESSAPWVLVSGGQVQDYFETHAAAITEASYRVCARHHFHLPPRRYGVYKRRDL